MSYWFQGKELGFAIGISLSLSRVASVMNSNMTPAIYDNTNSFLWSFFTGLMLVIFSFICCIIWIIIDKSVEVKAYGKKLVKKKIIFKDFILGIKNF